MSAGASVKPHLELRKPAAAQAAGVVKILASTLIAMVIAVLVGPRYIRWLQRRGIGQNIRELTPERHSAKQGTPTMGGLLILGAAFIPYVIFASKNVPSLVLFILTFGSGGIGFADDFMKNRRRRSLGLSARAKLALQVPLVVLAVFIALRFGGVDTSLSFPYLQDRLWPSAGSTMCSPSYWSRASRTRSTSPTGSTVWRRARSAWHCSP